MVLIKLNINEILKEFADRAQTGFAVSDLEGKILYINNAIGKLFKIPNNEKIIGRYIFDYEPELLDIKLRKEIIENLKKNGYWTGELVAKKETGEFFNTLQYIFIIRNKDGRAEYFGNIIIDITEQKEKSKILKESEEKFRTITEQSIMAILIIQDEKIKYVNKAIENISGYSPNELISWPPKQYYKIIYEEDLNLVQEQSILKQRGIKKNIIPHYSFRLVTKYNEIKWVEIYSNPIIYEGRYANLVNMIDITSMENAESKILQSEIKFQNLFNNMLDGFAYLKIIKNNDGEPNDFELLDINPSFMEILNVSREKVLGFKIKTLIENSKMDPNSIINPLFNVVTNRIPLITEIYIEKLSKWLNINAFSPQPDYLIVIFHDITEVKKSRELIVSEKETLNSILGSIQDGVIATDNKGNITLINQSAKEILEITNENNIEHKHFNEVITILNPNNNSLIIDPHHELINELYEIGRTILPVYILCTKSGKEKYIEISSTSLKGKELLGNVFVIRDVTKKRELETLINRNMQIESFGLLTASIAHRFNNLLTSILGNISLLKMDINEQYISEETKDLIKDIENSTINMKELIKKMLNFSKSETLSKKISDIKQLVKKTIDKIILNSHIKVEYYFEPDIYNSEIDENQIEQVIQNLIINAIQAIEKDGVIKISMKNIYINENNSLLLKKGKYVEISIEDNGIGIPKENLSKIFTPYFTTKKNGMGLGLSISYTIIKNHGGILVIDPNTKKGTKFKIFLPAI